MADVRPINALHYDLDVVGVARRRRRAALRRDRRRRAGRGCSPARPTTRSRSTCRNRSASRPRRAAERRPLRGRGADDRRLARGGRPGRRRRAGDLGDDPGLHRPRRRAAAPATGSSPGSGSRTTTTGQVRPHERTLPGPLAGPARPDPGHPPQPLADLLAQHRGPLAAGRAGARRRSPGARRPTKTAPSTGSGGSPTRRSSTPSPSCLAGAQLLIADGHHRYETARAYRDEVGGEGAARTTR